MGAVFDHQTSLFGEKEENKESIEKMCPWPVLNPRTSDNFKSCSYSNCYAKIAKRYNSGEDGFSF